MHLRLSLAGAVVAVLATPAAAFAIPDFTLDKTCYVSARPDEREPVTINASGFAGNTRMNVFVDEVSQAPADSLPQTDGLGNLSGSVQAPYVDSGQRLFTLRLAEARDNGQMATHVAKVTALSVTQSPSTPATTSSRVRFRVRGLTDKLAPVYAHYVFKGKVRQTVRLGKPYGDCGLLSVRRRQFPFKNPKPGRWWIQFDQEQAYNPQARLYTKLKVEVTKKPRPQH
ncbi:hypothetical protein [Candidatus Solirubrobacter pratensis]|uniref:hypothetical protein n=1 Tax=Candidatus Solirubrobacter pratensis TaxID=1298857 RepID=UPI0003F7D1F7|nr:hypothetical protein [Candidatus Solirubrobacter pratensis]